jgi:hypothetical protein
MKRFIVITCSFLVFFAGAASVWASCKQVAFASNDHHQSSGSGHTHDHHSDDGHSHDATIHCPTLDDFVPSTTFSLRHRAQNLNEVIWSALSLVSQQQNHTSTDSTTHGPPFLIFSPVPTRLLLSVLRI